jgi:tetratricopeptide (TPR) repeat protein
VLTTKQTALICAATVLAALSNAAATSVEEQLAQDRNLGKAFYENPTTGAEAVTEFKKALDLAPDSDREKLNYALALLRAGKSDVAVPILKDVQTHDPSLPHTWFNLGIYYKKNGDEDLAIEQFRQMLKLTPDEPIAHYQLATLLKTDHPQEGIAEFVKTEQLNPNLAAAHFQLYNLYRQTAQNDDAQREFQTWQDVKKQQEGAAIPEDVDWCIYYEIYDPLGAVTPVTTAMPPVYGDTVLAGRADPKTAGMSLIDATGKGQTDLLVWSATGVDLYAKGLTRVVNSGLAGLKGVVFIAPGDFDNDGLMDLCVVTEAGAALYRNTGGKFVKSAVTLPQRTFERAVWIDYDHDGDLDLILLGDKPALIRNQGEAGFAEKTEDFPFAAAARPLDAWKLRVAPDSKAFDLAVIYSNHAPVLYRDQLGGHYEATAYTGVARDLTQIEADFDGDGRADRARVAQDGTVHLMLNHTVSKDHWIRVQLTGVKSLKLAQDAEVEIKTGLLYERRMYDGVPLTFNIGAYATIDTVRTTWPNGLIQNETQQAANKGYKYEESQRASGSCPMIWTWDGAGFEFITDVLGVAPLGAADGDGTFFPVDHQEFVSIPGRALKPVNGYYDVRITEELSEVSYLDQVRLLAMDHPAGTEIYTNEKFKGPPYPDERLFGVSRRVYPVAAHEFSGQAKPLDVLPLLLKTDQKYPDQFARNELGVAEMHTLELDFAGAAKSGSGVLLLHGWVDWADGSTFRAASQESKAGLVMPYLQMQDAAGKWQTVNQDMGMPSGKPKTIAVDLKFLSASRKLRVVTNLCVYWDEIFLSEDAGAPQVNQREAEMLSADLGFRGFSESRIDAGRKQPDTYIYSSVSPTSYWNPTPGLYTRYGDVRELAKDVDDKLIVMGSGDELKLRFRADAFPALPEGWARDYLLKVDGWAKDSDANTAFPTSVEPLPFHAMSVYPYPKTEHFPDDAAHEKYRREYNTRPALKLLRPLGL